MVETTSITQSPDIAVVVGAYYELLGQVQDRNLEPEKRGYRILLSNLCTFVPAQVVRGPSPEDSRRFQRFAREWQSQRGAMSWVTEMAMCPAYQGIIGMGPIAIPLILARLESEGDEPDYWFWALRSLTGENPVTAEHRGNIVKMAQAWLEWGRNSGYAW